MKRVLFFLASILCLLSCTKDLDESIPIEINSSSNIAQRYITLNFSTTGQTLSWISGANVEASTDEGVTWNDVTSAKSVTVTGTTCLLRAKTGSTPFYGLGCSVASNFIGVSGHLGALIDYEADDLDYVPVADNQFSLVTLDADGNPDTSGDQYGLFCRVPGGSWTSTCDLTSINIQLPKTDTIGKWAYAHMFKSALAVSGSKSIKQMSLPATNLGVGCYYRMFYNWYTSKLPVSNLPATKLSSHCYEGMFMGSMITSLPKISFELLAPYCCKDMFSTCTALTNISDFTLKPIYLTKQVSADGSVLQERADHCYESMFDGCSNVEYINPYILSASDTAPYCYKYMFKGCESYKTTNPLMIMKLKADYLDEGSCYGMFEDCISLTRANITATSMYQVDRTNGDTSEKYKGAVAYMFCGCSKLAYFYCSLKTGMNDILGKYSITYNNYGTRDMFATSQATHTHPSAFKVCSISSTGEALWKAIDARDCNWSSPLWVGGDVSYIAD